MKALLFLLLISLQAFSQFGGWGKSRPGHSKISGDPDSVLISVPTVIDDNLYIGNPATGDIDPALYFQDDTDIDAHYLRWNDGIGTFEFSGNINVTTTANGGIIRVGKIASNTGGATALQTYTGTFNIQFMTDAANMGTATFNGIYGNNTPQAITLAAAATTFAVANNLSIITGDGGGNTIATITGAIPGKYIFEFADGNVTITDTDAHTANTVDLSAAFTGADDTILELYYNGTSWYEVSRSTN